MEAVDMLKSVRRFVHGLAPVPDKYLQRVNADDFKRPSFLVRMLPTSSAPLHQSAHVDVTIWALTYFGESMDTCSAACGLVKAKLLEDLYIPAWTFSTSTPELTGLMRVEVSSINLDVLEDPDYLTKWNGILRFTTKVTRGRFSPLSQQLMQVIGATYGEG